MNRPFLYAVALAMLSVACPKTVPTDTGSDDERMDQYAAQLDELKTRVQAQEPTCSQWCAMSKTMAGLTQNTCEVAGRNPDRADMQQRCLAAQEELARFQDHCSRCSSSP